jgi:OOP family OmpA-OmpF porin
MTRYLAPALFAALALSIAPADATAQSLRDRLKRKAEDVTVKTAGDKMECAAGAKDCATKPDATNPAAAKPATTSAAESTAAAPAAAAGTADALKPGEGAWANYDFKPGDRILYADDFSKDEVGDFPRSLQFVKGSMEVVEWQGARYLRATGADNHFIVNLPEALPERFTIEFDYANAHGKGWGGLLIGLNGKDAYNEGGTNRLRCNHDAAGIDGSGDGIPQAIKAPPGKLESSVFRCRYMVDGTYLKAYVNETRVANVPNAQLNHGRQLFFTVYTRDSEKHPALIGNIRVAAGGKKLYDALKESGRVATQGIYFDTGADRLRPESTPTLKEIAAMLTEHPDLKLVIEGHTDDVGQAAANQALSEKRAAAVRQYLIDAHQVDGARLTAKGFGSTKPAAPNTTPAGRQTNRRVELVKA